MKFIKRTILNLILLASTVYSQYSQNISLVSKFSEGPSFTVASDDSIIYLGDGCNIDILELKANNAIEKINVFNCDYLVREIEIKGNNLFAATDGGLYILNIEDKLFPVQLDIIETEGNCMSIYLNENYAYLTTILEGVLIYDISDLNSPNLISVIESDSTEYLRQLSVKDSLLYLCDSRGDLQIFNISDINNPDFVSNYKFELDYSPTAISIKDDFAFICTRSNNYYGALGKFVVCDITNPNAITQIYSNNIPGDWTSEGKDIFIQDSLLIIPYSSDVNKGVEIYGIADSRSPVILNSSSVLGLEGIETSDSYAVSLIDDKLIISEGGWGMTMYSLGDFSAPQEILTIRTCDTVNDLFVDNGRIYAACGYSGLNRYRFENDIIYKENNITRQKFSLMYNTSVYVKDGFAFLTNTPAWGYGFHIFNVQHYSLFEEIGGAETVEGVNVVVDGNYAFVAARFYGLIIFDISDKANPVQIYNQNFDISGTDLIIKGSKCYFAAKTNGIFVYDIGVPSSPKELFHFQTEKDALDIAVKDSVIFIAEGQNGIRILNEKDSANNILVNNELKYSRKLRIENNYLYVIDDSKGVVIYDISSPFNPNEVGYYNLGKAKPKNIYVKGDQIFVSQGQYGFSIFQNDLLTSTNKKLNSVPNKLILYQNYPNPFNPNTKIEFYNPLKSNVTVEIYSILGEKISTIVNKEFSPGNHKVEFDGTELSSGMYIYVVKTNDFVQAKKMLLIK